MSFPRKSAAADLFNYFWTPVFTGVTGFLTFYEAVKVASLIPILKILNAVSSVFFK